MEIAIVNESSPEWAAVLAAVPHDIYHLPSYLAMSASREVQPERAKPRAVIAREGDRAMLLPIIVRGIPGQDAGSDAISPYGYPGPLFQGDADSDFIVRAFAGVIAHLRDNDIVSLFVRLHPILNRHLAGLIREGVVVEHGETVVIDLTATTADLWSATRSGHRNEINRSIRAGNRAYIDADWVNEARFVDLYVATMGRVGASAAYMFGADYLRDLREALGSRLHLCVVDVDGTIAAAGLFTEECGIVQYHLSGTDEAFAQARPTKLMLHFVRGWMKERGNRVMQLGGGVGGARDSLFDFKAGFSRQRQPFHTWRVVIDPKRYAALSQARHPGVDPTDLRGYFPLYRR